MENNINNEIHINYMKKAIDIAKKGAGKVNPNPLVGAIIVKNGKIIGEGYHKYYGGNHAEVEAINNAIESVENADLYVTLEPCSHYGKTPPCVKKIIENKIKRVFIGTKDFNPVVCGNGIKILEQNKIEVFYDICKNECLQLNEIFFKYITTKTPFVLMKTAMTIDGKIATKTGKSKWISNEESRKYVHKLRNDYSAIMVGINTIIADNPKLDSRIENAKNPIKIIIDSNLRIPENSNVLDTSNSRCIIATSESPKNYQKIQYLKNNGVEIIQVGIQRVNLKKLMTILGNMGIDSILLEGGGELNFSALNENIVDKVISFISPKIFGGNTAKTPVMGEGINEVEKAFQLYNTSIDTIYDNDSKNFVITGYLKKGD